MGNYDARRALTTLESAAAFVTFDSVSRALLVPAVFFGINLIEGNLVTPMILGRRMRLNTVALFIGRPGRV